MSVATRTAPGRPPSWLVPSGERLAPSAALGTARTTGLLYLALALTGLAGFLILRPQVFTDDAATVAALVEHESVARLVVALELGVVVAQALVAVWFYRLFRSVDTVAAGAVAAFGLVNATAILVSAASLATALELALDPIGDAAGQVHLLIGLSDNLWLAGGLFFGLWLVPMGLLVLRCAGMPRLLGWLLIGGGVGYVLSAFVTFLAPGAQPVADGLAITATIGEVWMIGYLLHGGVFRGPAAEGRRSL
jgi:Domain of unknown function (DUF4386)